MTQAAQNQMVTDMVNDLNDDEIKSLQSYFRKPTKEDLIEALNNKVEDFQQQESDGQATGMKPEEFLKNEIQTSLDYEQLWRYNHRQRADQTDLATDAFAKLDRSHIDILKEYYDVDDDYDLIDAIGDDYDLFEVQDQQDNTLEGAEALNVTLQNVYNEQLYARNHTQRVSQTNVAREAVEQDLDPEHVEAMKRYYEADNNDELVEIMGDDDSLFEAHTEDGKVLEGKEALMQNVNKIHDENLTMNFGAGLDDLSDMGREYEYTLPDGKHVKVSQADGPYTTAYIDDNDKNLTTDFGDGLDALSGDMEQRESEHTLPDGMI